MKVLQVSPDLGHGGAERVVADLSIGLKEMGHDVLVASMFPQGGTAVEEVLRAAGVRTVFLRKRLGLDVRVAADLHRLTLGFAPDVVHTHRYALKYLAPSFGMYRGVAVHTVHNVADREVPKVDQILHGLLFRRRVTPVAVSAMVAESVHERYGVQPSVILNGADTVRFSPSGDGRRAWRAKHGFGDEFLAALVGRLQEQKNVRDALEVVAASRHRPTLRLIVAGDGPMRQELERHAGRLGIAESVRFLGVVGDVPQLLSAVDAVVSSSLWEGMPLALIEAQAAGAPVVAYGVGGVPEVLEDGKTGYVVTPKDVSALTAALDTLISDPARRAEMGTAARQRVIDRMSLRRCVDEYTGLYAREVSRRSGYAVRR